MLAELLRIRLLARVERDLDLEQFLGQGLPPLALLACGCIPERR
jgi:hypothetical protein